MEEVILWFMRYSGYHSMFEEGDDREEVIRKYKYDFDFEKFPHIDKSEVFKLVGKRLGCFVNQLLAMVMCWLIF
jgi:hypothetical protein